MARPVGPARPSRRAAAGPAARRRRTAALAAGVLLATATTAVVGQSTASAAAVTLLNDTFTRTVSSGWGTADSGGAWTRRGGSASQYGVNGTAGTLKLSANSRLNLDANAVSALEQDITATVTADKVATGGGDYFAVVARRHSTNEQYAAQINLASSTPSLTLYRRDSASAQINIGSTVSFAGTSFTARTWWKIRLVATGANPTTLRAKAWPAASAEPAAWSITATDSTAALQSAGTPGYAAGLSSAATNAPVTQLVDAIVVTSTTSTPPPSTPTGLAAVAGDGQVALSWTAVSGATGYAVYRDGVAVASPTATSFTDTGRTNGTTYSYAVAATGPGGTSLLSAGVTATPMPTVPATPTGLTATPGDSQVALTWAPVAGATSYAVTRDGSPVGSPTTAAFTDTGLVNGTSYSYRVSASNLAGTSSPSAAVTAVPQSTPTVPSAPTGLVAVPGDASVSLTWNAVAGATGYVVSRNGSPVGSPTTAAFTDSGLVNGTAYSYTVVATNAVGASAASAAVSATPALPGIPPAVPTGLSAAAYDTQVALSWNPVPGAMSYVVSRNGSPVGAAVVTTFYDAGLVNGTTYSYAVAAVNAGGTSAASAPVTAVPAAARGALPRPTDTAGAVPLGSASYPPPADAVYVSPSGSDDTGTGSLAAPWATLARALAAAPAGGTIVLRGGTYHQDLVTIASPVTVQNYPGEAVWFDGAAAVGGWTASGTTWTTAYPYVFDHSPTYVVGAPDNTAYGWNFVNPSYPMAPYPDMVWIGGVELTQVSSLAAVVPGTFYVDTALHQLTVGTSPVGALAEVATYQQLFKVTADGVTLRGFGVKRYADSVPMAGVVGVFGARALLENLVMTDSATEGFGVSGPDAVLRHLTVRGAGLTGVHAWKADGLVVDGLDARFNTDERFNYIPVSGGLKVTKSRHVTLENSWLSDNYGMGAWFDESSYDLTIAGNEIDRNAYFGLYTEISTKGVVTNNVIVNNGATGYKIDSSWNWTVWNNTFIDNAVTDYRARDLNIVQSPRVYSCTSAGADLRFCPAGDPTMSWLSHDISIRNNIFKMSVGQGFFGFEDFTFTSTGQMVNITLDNGAYIRTGTGTRWVIIWSAGTGNNHNPYVYTTLSGFQTAQGEDLHSVYADVGAPVPTPKPLGLSAAVAAAGGRPVGDLHMGAY